MSNFWDFSSQPATETNFMPETNNGGGEWYFGDGQKLAVTIDNAEVTETQKGNPAIKLRWSVVSPEKDAKGIKMQNRKVFQTIYSAGSDYDETEEKKAKTIEKARKFYAAIDALMGGNLMKLGRMPTSEDMMQHWMAKAPVTIRVGLILDKDTKQPERNFVSGVGPYEKEYALKEGVWKRDNATTAAVNSGYGAGGTPMTANNSYDDEIPFAPNFL